MNTPDMTRIQAALDLHAERRRTVDGYTLRWCRECGQDYPCPTVQTLGNGSSEVPS